MHLREHLYPLVAIGVFGAACGPRPPVIEPSANGAVIRGAKTGLYTKEVMTKKDPDTLFAADGTFCRVPADRYKDTAAHTLIYCNWQ
jgi:disulfide bond formation protein DsbB